MMDDMNVVSSQILGKPIKMATRPCRKQRSRRSFNVMMTMAAFFLVLLIVPGSCSATTTSSQSARLKPFPKSSLLHDIRGGSTRPAYALAKKLYSQSTSQPLHQHHDDRLATKEAMDAFLTRDSRQSFIARVYAILSAQLLFTAGAIGLFAKYPQIAMSMVSSRSNPITTAVPMISLAVSTICWITICMSPNARRSSPMKWQLLSLFTLGEAIGVGFISSFYKPASVCLAMLATATAVGGISAYTIRNKDSKYDLSTWGASLSSAGLLFCVYGMLTLLQSIGWLPAGFLPYHETLYSFLGATLFSGYLAYHTRLIVSGKHTKYQMNEKDYVFGAMSLYNDIISMFIYILRLIGEDRDGGGNVGGASGGSRRRR